MYRLLLYACPVYDVFMSHSRRVQMRRYLNRSLIASFWSLFYIYSLWVTPISILNSEPNWERWRQIKSVFFLHSFRLDFLSRNNYWNYFLPLSSTARFKSTCQSSFHSQPAGNSTSFLPTVASPFWKRRSKYFTVNTALERYRHTWHDLN